MRNTYCLLDSGSGKKLERYGPYSIVRPASQAIWMPCLSEGVWQSADAQFTREGRYRWEKQINGRWTVEIEGLHFYLQPTDFGHLGVFPEQSDLWKWIRQRLQSAHGMKLLNLFAYSGGATLAAASVGAKVCHVDASRGMVSWARKNAALNSFEKKPIRWIIEDVRKFLTREKRRNNRYDAIVLDPPTYGRGSKGEVFKFEKDLYPLLEECRALLNDHASFFILTCHAPNITPMTLGNLLIQVMREWGGITDHGELLLKGEKDVFPLPTGVFARWASG